MIWTLLVTKTECPFKNELGYQIKPLKPIFFKITSVSSCTLYFDALITELFKICLVVDKNSREGIIPVVFFDVSRMKWGVSLTRESSE